MATIVESCPKCHQNASVEFGELHNAILKWYLNLNCSECGYHEALEGLGRLPYDYRRNLLQQEGQYQLCFESVHGHLIQIQQMIRDVFLPSSQEMSQFKADLAQGYLVGTYKEVHYIQMRLYEAFDDIKITIQPC